MRHSLRVVAMLLALSATAQSQTLLDRSPNLSGDWVGAPGTLYFHFIHRFTAGDAPSRKVSNVPTFLFAAGLPKRFLAGVNYSTNSTLAPNFPNEWELFARWAPIAQDFGAPLDVGGQIGYNNAADGVDGEISAARRAGPLRLIVAGRALSNPVERGDVRFAVAGGGTVRLGQYVALAGDVATLTDKDSSERVAWSAGVHIAIPLTPHTLSLHATNAPVGTLQGQSRGSSKVRYGFEFTIPLTLRRYFGKREPVTVTDSATPSPAPVADTQSPVPDTRSLVPGPGSPVADTRSPVLPADTARSQPVQGTPGTGNQSPGTGNQSPGTGNQSPGTGNRAPVTGNRAPTPSKPRVPASTKRTVIKNISYLQPKIQVTVGTTVEWTNNDPLPHSVTAVDKSFNSGLIQPGKTFRHTFTRAGTYDFYCMPHPFMKGVVVVKEP